jgi:hypothetical protein
LPEVEGGKLSKKEFKACPIGYFHIDLAEVQTAEGKLYLYVAIDRTSKFAFVQLVKKTRRTSASAFLKALIAAVPYKIHTVLTDNGTRYADGPTARYATHMFDMRCRENGIEHRLTKLKHPWDQWPGRAHGGFFLFIAIADACCSPDRSSAARNRSIGNRVNAGVRAGVGERSDAYKRHAVECDAAAARITDPEIRFAYLAMGARWRKMAEQQKAIEDFSGASRRNKKDASRECRIR